MDLNVGPVGVAALVVAVTEGVKSIFGTEGKANQIVAVVAGIVLTAVAYGIGFDLIPEVAILYIEWVVVSIAGGLSAIGVYDLLKVAVLKK